MMRYLMMMMMMMMGSVGCDGSGTEEGVNDPAGGVELKGAKMDMGVLQEGDIPVVGVIDYYNDPGQISPDFERRYEMLPLQGKTKKIPWTDTYWPKNKGGISHRWQTGETHYYQSPSKDELASMSKEEISRLSPTEKYDIYAGNYEYPLTLRIQAENSPNETDWQGYCHGWTSASIHFEEPSPVVMVNEDGLEIPFGSSDIKALLTYFQGEVVRSLYGKTYFPFLADITVVGSVCTSNMPTDVNCYDTNPGSFHVILANMVGIRGEAFGIDATNSSQKWNQPVHAYRTEVLATREPSVGASPDAVKELIIRSTVTYTQEIEPTWNSVGGTEEHSDTDKVYSYTLELNEYGEIMGGQWLLLMEDTQQTLSLHQAWDYLMTLDENGDGKGDFSKDEAKNIIWSHYDFPDYAYVQEKGVFSEEFRQVSKYEILTNTFSNRKVLYQYFAKLGDIYEAGTVTAPSFPSHFTQPFSP